MKHEAFMLGSGISGRSRLCMPPKKSGRHELPCLEYKLIQFPNGMLFFFFFFLNDNRRLCSSCLAYSTFPTLSVSFFRYIYIYNFTFTHIIIIYGIFEYQCTEKC